MEEDNNSTSFMFDVRTTTNSEIYLNLSIENISTTPFIVQSSDEFYYSEQHRDPFYVVIPITLIYAIIFVTGFIGNISTCIVISRNKSMHTATNYYLFSLAVSDFLLLTSGVPMELYHIWYKHEFIFGEVFCILRNAINEMSANATVLTSMYNDVDLFHQLFIPQSTHHNLHFFILFYSHCFYSGTLCGNLSSIFVAYNVKVISCHKIYLPHLDIINLFCYSTCHTNRNRDGSQQSWDHMVLNCS